MRKIISLALLVIALQSCKKDEELSSNKIVTVDVTQYVYVNCGGNITSYTMNYPLTNTIEDIERAMKLVNYEKNQATGCVEKSTATYVIK